ncbi:hypothetical protein TPHA_0F00170 [Tetrapisispora phaffii CBS 4417]|uniref:Amino acid permease/ SLC12A domain-containing protein n=1 Tax=Tetrapisispora phaffii (strain ATCC 24235 / CBS 4417 / NBRC 1672 / NRRL Y-8282 / UCD 70-5) TaxID=1071381 RepID=G8BUS2_TETPH|nr:hypothetical protein TPHA_0F00170 [Tetrapisispora phaffii CBS 4417]CCE63504.1 hypothetical protein TPHA_0F00170 [Tetrapisispora phaffii CBS 4417]
MEDTRLLFSSQAIADEDDYDINLSKVEIPVKYGSFSSLESGTLLDIEPNLNNYDDYDNNNENEQIKELSTEVPQGRHLGVFSTMVLFICRMVGSGIFATPSSILVNCGGNATLFLGVWIIAALVALSGLYLFLEFGSWLPRSGGKKNFLEQAYNKPKLMMSVSFGLFSVLTGLAMSNSIIFGKYVSSILDIQNLLYSRYISISLIVTVIIIHGFSVKTGVRIQNFLGGLKFILIFLICATGFYSMFFYDNSNENNLILWKDFQYDSELSLSSLASAFINAFFCFSGWDSVHAVSSEIKNPNRTLKLAGPMSLFICFICYLMMNLAYLKVLTYEEIKEAGPLVGSVLFIKLFGDTIGGKLMSLSIILSSISNVFIVLYGISRMNQEIFREGYLPFSKYLVKNWPTGAPFPSLLIGGLLSISWLVFLPPAGKSFDYLVNMEGYGNQFFLLLISIGIFIFRREQQYATASIRCPNMCVWTIILVSMYLLIAPFIGNQDINSVGHFPPYQVTALLLVYTGFLYWFITFYLTPKIFCYKLIRKVVIQKDGLSTTEWIHNYN